MILLCVHLQVHFFKTKIYLNLRQILRSFNFLVLIKCKKKTAQNFQSDQMIFLKITKDSIFQYENTFKDHPEKSGWKISSDTIHLTSRGYTFLDYKILEINDELLKVQSTIHLKSSHSGTTLIKSNKIEHYERLK